MVNSIEKIARASDVPSLSLPEARYTQASSKDSLFQKTTPSLFARILNGLKNLLNKLFCGFCSKTAAQKTKLTPQKRLNEIANRSKYIVASPEQFKYDQVSFLDSFGTALSYASREDRKDTATLMKQIEEFYKDKKTTPSSGFLLNHVEIPMKEKVVLEKQIEALVEIYNIHLHIITGNDIGIHGSTFSPKKNNPKTHFFSLCFHDNKWWVFLDPKAAANVELQKHLPNIFIDAPSSFNRTMVDAFSYGLPEKKEDTLSTLDKNAKAENFENFEAYKQQVLKNDPDLKALNLEMAEAFITAKFLAKHYSRSINLHWVEIKNNIPIYKTQSFNSDHATTNEEIHLILQFSYEEKRWGVGRMEIMGIAQHLNPNGDFLKNQLEPLEAEIQKKFGATSKVNRRYYFDEPYSAFLISYNQVTKQILSYGEINQKMAVMVHPQNLDEYFEEMANSHFEGNKEKAVLFTVGKALNAEIEVFSPTGEDYSKINLHVPPLKDPVRIPLVKSGDYWLPMESDKNGIDLSKWNIALTSLSQAGYYL